MRFPTVASFGPQLALNDYIAVDASHNLIAPSVSLGPHTIVGDVQTTTLTNNGGSFHVEAAFPASMPPIPLAMAPSLGVVDLSVGEHQTATLNPGSYGVLSVGEYAIVALNPGDYSFSSATIAQHVSMVASASGVTIRVGSSLAIGELSSIAPNGATASKLVLSVNGADGAESAVDIGSHTSITALVEAPHGTISISDHVSFTGAFAGFDVKVGDHTTIQYQSGFSPTAAGQTGSQQLSGYTRAPVGGAPIVGVVPPTTTISVGVGLPVTNEDGLKSFATDVSNPSSPSYLHYLTLEQFADTFGVSVSDYNTLTEWALAQGFAITTYPNRLMLDITGSASLIDSALHVTMVYGQRSDGTQFFEADRQPSVDTSVAILSISGLDNFVVARSGHSGTGTQGSIVPSDLRTAYIGDCGLGLDGHTESVGIFSYDGFDPNDITTYESNTGITGAATVESVLSGGATAFAEGKFEITGDIEMVLAMAPHAQVVVFNSGSNGDDSLMKMATRPDIHQFSNSFFSPGFPDQQGLNALYEMASQGQSFFSLSGDCTLDAEGNDTGMGKYVEDLLDIRDAPFVTLVGGTELEIPSGAVTSETAWVCSGGGPFPGPPGESIPYYQADVLPAGIQFRSAPDVAAASDGLYLYVGTDVTDAFGTSFSTPQWAGMMALINEERVQNGIPPVGFANPLLYGVAKATTFPVPSFRDITTGSNGYDAGPGYDLATGLGVPTCGLLTNISMAHNPTIHVAIKANEAFGPDVCITGSGFPPGAPLFAEYFGLPGLPGIIGTFGGTTTVQPDGTFSITDSEFYGLMDCDSTELFGTVSVSVVGGGLNLSADIPEEYWCTEGLAGGIGTCP